MARSTNFQNRKAFVETMSAMGFQFSPKSSCSKLARNSLE